MGQVIAVVIIILLVIFIFIPLSVLDSNNMEVRDIKQSLNLSARALANCISGEDANMETLSEGYEKPQENNIMIDKARLLSEFDDLLAKNICIGAKLKAIKDRILIKVLVYRDMFYIADRANRWSPPFFFIFQDKTYGQIYLSIKSNQAYYFANGVKTYISIANLGLDEEKRDEIIINSINEKVAQSTYEINARNGLRIQIQNPNTEDIETKIKMSYFNVLEGTTFFVVYGEDTRININTKNFHYKNYNVTGYTLEVG